jgi:hypothetical protein
MRCLPCERVGCAGTLRVREEPILVLRAVQDRWIIHRRELQRAVEALCGREATTVRPRQMPNPREVHDLVQDRARM